MTKALIALFILFLVTSGLALTVSAQDPPTLFLRAKATADVKINLGWEMTNETGVAKYNIYWDSEEYDDVSGRTPDATTTEVEYTISGLHRHTKYYFTVTAVDSGGSVLAKGSDTNTPGKYADIGDLKEVNYWAIMGFAGVALVFYLIALWKIPTWVKEEKEMVDRETEVI